jgi:hypothetical protein
MPAACNAAAFYAHGGPAQGVAHFSQSAGAVVESDGQVFHVRVSTWNNLH